MSGSVFCQLVNEYLPDGGLVVHVGSSGTNPANYTRLNLCPHFFDGRDNVVLREYTGRTRFHVVRKSEQNSSILKPVHSRYTRRKIECVELPCRTLDDVCAEQAITPDVLVMDVQGAELLVLQGARRVITNVKIAVLEVTYPEPNPLYEGGATAAVVDVEMSKLGFRCHRSVPAKSVLGPNVYGNAYYVRDKCCAQHCVNAGQ